MAPLSRLYSWLLIRGWWVRLRVKGKENLPKKNERICIIANHQSLSDIPLMQLCIPPMIGFVSKVELNKFYFMRIWMQSVKNVAMDRKSPRQSMKAIMKGIEQIKSGYPMLIFPEGTRSSCNRMRQFKKGSFKMALKSKSQIVPVTIDGSHKLIQTKPFATKPFQKITITIHPTIDSTKLSDDEVKNIDKSIWDLINSGLETPNTEVMEAKIRKK